MSQQQLSIKTLFYSLQSVYQLLQIFDEELKKSDPDSAEHIDLKELHAGHDMAFTELAKAYDVLAADASNFELSKDLFADHFAKQNN